MVGDTLQVVFMVILKRSLLSSSLRPLGENSDLLILIYFGKRRRTFSFFSHLHETSHMQFKWLCSGFPGRCGHVHPLQLTLGVQATDPAGCCRYKGAPVSSCARASLQTVVILLMEYEEKSVLGDFGLTSFSFRSNTMDFFCLVCV